MDPHIKRNRIKIETIKEVKSKLVDLPDSSTQEQERLWGELLMVIENFRFHNPFIKHSSKIEELKQRFTIQKRVP